MIILVIIVEMDKGGAASGYARNTMAVMTVGSHDDDR